MRYASQGLHLHASYRYISQYTYAITILFKKKKITVLTIFTIFVSVYVYVTRSNSGRRRLSSEKMWHEARKQEKKIRVAMVDYQRRAERRREHYEKMVRGLKE